MTLSFFHHVAQKMKVHFAAHWVAYVLAFAAAGIVVAPVILGPRSLGAEYKGIPFLYQDSEYRYLARIHEVLDGHPSLGSPMVAEYKDAPTPFAPIGEDVYAVLSKVLFLSLPHVVVLTKFFFPFLLFVLIYLFVFVTARETELSMPKIAGITAASLVVLGYEFADIGRLPQLWQNFSSLYYVSLWTRLVNPITGALCLFGFLLSWWGMVRGKRFAWLAGGVLLGLMTGYIFSFSIALVTALISVGWYAYLRNYSAVKKILGAIAVGAVVNVFQFADFFRSLSAASGQDFALRGGLLLTHVPLISRVFVGATLVWLAVFVLPRFWFAASRSVKDAHILMVSLIAAVFIAMNQQILTGKTVWPQHFVQYTIPIAMILLVLSAAAVVMYVAKKWSPALLVGKCAAIFLVLMCFVFGLRTVHSYTFVAADFADRQRYADTFEWLNTHVPRDCAVFAVEKKDVLADMLPAFTHCNVYHTSFTFSGMPYERIVHNYFAWLRFSGLSAADSPAYFASHITEARELLFADWKELFRDSTDPWLTRASDRTAIDAKYAALAPKLAEQYQQFVRTDFYTSLKKYQLDYVTWDRTRDPDLKVDRFPFLKPVFSANGVSVFQVVSPK